MLVTGHNLDDEAAVLYGNTLRWELEYLARQLPALPARDGFPKKVKPLVRLSERETAAWCVIRGIDYLVEECPIAAGNRHLGVQGRTQHDRGPVAGHQDRVLPQLRREGRAAARRLRPVRRRRAAVRAVDAARRRPGEICAFCNLVATAAGHEPVPVETDHRQRERGAMSKPFDYGERVLLLDFKQRRYLVILKEGGEFHSHNGFVPHADIVGNHEGLLVQVHQGVVVHRAAADARGLRGRDAARRAGDLPQGPRADLHARRHRPGGAGVRERGRQRRVVDDDAALGRGDRRLRDPRGLRQPGDAPTCGRSSARTP